MHMDLHVRELDVHYFLKLMVLPHWLSSCLDSHLPIDFCVMLLCSKHCTEVHTWEMSLG